MAKPVHSMIRVLDEAKSLDFYARAFGLRIADRLVFPDFALIYLRHPSSPFELELTVNFDRKEPYVTGDGYGHLAVVVDDQHVPRARVIGQEDPATGERLVVRRVRDRRLEGELQPTARADCVDPAARDLADQQAQAWRRATAA